MRQTAPHTLQATFFTSSMSQDLNESLNVRQTIDIIAPYAVSFNYYYLLVMESIQYMTSLSHMHMYMYMPCNASCNITHNVYATCTINMSDS